MGKKNQGPFESIYLLICQHISFVRFYYIVYFNTVRKNTMQPLS